MLDVTSEAMRPMQGNVGENAGNARLKEGAAAPDQSPFDGPITDIDQMDFDAVDFDAELETLDPVYDSEPIIASPSAAQTTGPPDGLMTDKITTEYHPNSGRPP
ncbi:hypothetical protein EDB86DRAFT_2827574 [Lactarius hatsudake]|nr:hypothetical protein EDB86DRAFT_2827574 [Lactarius hatsudake]